MNKDDCNGCSHYITCTTPCLYLSTIRGMAGKNKVLQEKLAPPDISIINNLEYLPGETEPTNVDYKTMLTRNKEARENAVSITIKEIRDIPDRLKKAVAAMLYAELDLNDVAIVLNISTDTVRRICKR